MSVESPAWNLLFEEGCALVLLGRFDESLALLDGLPKRRAAEEASCSVVLNLLESDH